jgi:phosphoenolpyruvate-protein kinase (PTS system EI component)
VAAARTAGIRVEVCGEAASTPLMAPLLVGLGVDELSVGAARVGLVRRWVRAMRYDALAPLAERALALDRPEEVEALMARDRAGDGDR